MGNLTHIVATKNLEKFNLVGVLNLLKNEKPKYSYKFLDRFQQVQVEHKGYMVIEFWDDDLWFGEEELRQELDEETDNELKEGLQHLVDIEIWKLPILGATNSSHWFKQNTDILKILHKEYGLYIFDEGIHPEYINPEYIFS